MALTEFKAMEQIAAALDQVDDATRARILRWLSDRYDGVFHMAPPQHALPSAAQKPSVGFADFAELFDASGAKKEGDRVLVAGYWLQTAKNVEDWTATEAQAELKNLGQHVSNMAVSLKRLADAKPRVIIQTSAAKEGKRFKLTSEGFKKVKALLEEPKEN